MAHERMAEATPSASSRSSGSPWSRVRLRRAYTDFGRWVRCAAGPETLRPKTWLAGAVRSGDPSCPPFGLHCAAARLRWAVVDKLKTPWDVVGGFDRRRQGDPCPCTAVEDLRAAIRPVGGIPGGENPDAAHFSPAMREQIASRRQAVSHFAAKQHGVAAYDELISLGLSSSAVGRWAADGS